MEAGATGTGVTPTHSANDRMVTISATAGSGTSFMQSYRYCPYVPAKSSFIAITGLMGAGVANCVKEFGYFDAENGIIYRQDGTNGLYVVRRSSTSGSVVDSAVAQASWNIDKMDGTGPSGITLDVTKVFIVVVDLQFLGMGRIRVGFDINGVLYYVHEFLNANILTVPYMQTATLPVQALMTCTSTAAPASMKFKCASVISEGGFLDNAGFTFSTPEGTVTAASGARTHLVSMRPRTTFNSLVNREYIRLEDFNLIVTGNNPIFYELVIGATFSVAPTWANVNTTNSSVEYGTGGTFSSLSSGIVIDSGYINASAQNKGSINDKVSTYYPITLDRAGLQRAMGTVSLLVTGIGGTSATRGTLTYSEIR